MLRPDACKAVAEWCLLRPSVPLSLSPPDSPCDMPLQICQGAYFPTYRKREVAGDGRYHVVETRHQQLENK